VGQVMDGIHAQVAQLQCELVAVCRLEQQRAAAKQEAVAKEVAELQLELQVERQRAATRQEAAAKEVVELQSELQMERQRAGAEAQAVTAAVKEAAQWRKKLQEAEAFIRGRGLHKVQVERPKSLQTSGDAAATVLKEQVAQLKRQLQEQQQCAAADAQAAASELKEMQELNGALEDDVAELEWEIEEMNGLTLVRPMDVAAVAQRVYQCEWRAEMMRDHPNLVSSRGRISGIHLQQWLEMELGLLTREDLQQVWLAVLQRQEDPERYSD